MLRKLLTRCRLPPNHKSFFRSLSLSSALVTLNFALAFCLSLSAKMFSIVIGQSSYLEVHASVMLSCAASITDCILSISFGCRSYLLRSTPCTLSHCYIWSPVTSMMSESHLLSARSSSSRCNGSSMLLIAAGPMCQLRFFFSLYASL